MRKRTRLFSALALLALAGCAFSPYEPDPQPLEPGRLPKPNVGVTIPHLGPCTDSPDRTLRFNSNYPVTVLVHGCNGSAGRFRSLAQLYAFHGQQSVCFSYDDRDSLMVSSRQLIGALDDLAGRLRDHRLTVIGHSMGGLVARKALELDGRSAWRNEAKITLATVSAPISGIAVSSTCGVTALQWLSLGTLPASCWLVTGDNWNEITPYSDFIRRPGPLLPSVQRYLKVVTDERGTCRRRGPDGICRESDYVFTLAEQYQPVVDKYPQLTNVEVDAGHVEIVGYKDVAPRKLLAILQREDLLAPTPPEQRSALERLLTILY
jgi:pimeloyl-ACP methyl ester carboxylesterase